jgi:hypothetical protein
VDAHNGGVKTQSPGVSIDKWSLIRTTLTGALEQGPDPGPLKVGPNPHCGEKNQKMDLAKKRCGSATMLYRYSKLCKMQRKIRFAAH